MLILGAREDNTVFEEGGLGVGGRQMETDWPRAEGAALRSSEGLFRALGVGWAEWGGSGAASSGTELN